MMKKKFTMQKKLHRLGEMLIELVGRLFPDYAGFDIIKVFKMNEMIAYTKLIHAPYLIFWLDVKSWF